MKPINEEQRKQLTAFARIEISRWKLASDKQYMVELMEISLASLTAEPEYNTSEEGGEINLEVSKSEYDKCHPDYRWISYTAPPVPVIKLPDEDFELGEAHGIQRRVDFRNGANYVIAEIKRLNNLE